MARKPIVAAISSVSLVALLASCGVTPLSECEDDDQCRFGRVCVEGACAFPGAGGGTSPGTRDTGTEPVPRPSLEEFCQGEARAEVGGTLVEPVAVTTTHRPLRDCCEDVALRFHTEDEVGFYVWLNVGWMGGPMELGPFDAAAPPDGVDLVLCQGQPSECEPFTLTGHISVDTSAGDGSALISVCVEVEQPGGDLDGARLYVEDAFLVPWGWDDHFGFYLIANNNLTAMGIVDRTLGGLPLYQNPAIDLTTLLYYDVEDHELVFDPVFVGDLVEQIPEVGVEGRPFVVTTGVERIYAGAFMTQVSSYCFPGPTVMIEEIRESSFTIGQGCPDEGVPDRRVDGRLLNALREANRLVE